MHLQIAGQILFVPDFEQCMLLVVRIGCSAKGSHILLLDTAQAPNMWGIALNSLLVCLIVLCLVVVFFNFLNIF